MGLGIKKISGVDKYFMVCSRTKLHIILNTVIADAFKQ